ncbi:hypothetical protein AVEN_81174-1 [Araneus ventricosus]|uniref:Uncharacterized protein n=1 Tax=Araneus ventricosus TaxID=182803 RepID=A0A4Y2QNJ8_ARAVE|nr:hypothetical protein AVEN_81174-1 [Araneus ventricosus]
MNIFRAVCPSEGQVTMTAHQIALSSGLVVLAERPCCSTGNAARVTLISDGLSSNLHPSWDCFCKHFLEGSQRNSNVSRPLIVTISTRNK